jgi:dienelactone hydrolase
MAMPRTTVREREVRVPVESAPKAGPVHAVSLEGNLALPEGAKGLVLFAHGSGSSRFSPRNRFVARSLQEAGLATLLIDLLSPQEEALDVRTAELRFDLPFLARRLAEVIDWLEADPQTQNLPVGLFGASTGGGAALMAAVERPERVKAVVSRGGRPDLAAPVLPRVSVPTLLIVGGEDAPVIAMNQEAFERLRGEKQLWIVPGATHLFEEPGTLEQVANLAVDWFQTRLR